MSTTQIEKQLLSIARDFLKELHADRAIQAISLDASLERELGIDSLGRVELFHRIENTLSLRLSEKALAEAESLQELIKYIEDANAHITTIQQSSTFSPTLETISLDLTSANSLTDVLKIYASIEPERPHIYLQDESGQEKIIRYGQLFNAAIKVAEGLRQRGIQPGETVAIMVPTSEDFFYAFSGILLSGAIPVPIYPPFRPDRIEEYIKREAKILKNAQVRLLITFTRAEMLSHLLRSFIPSLKEVTTVNKLQTKTNQLPNVEIQSNDIALIQYTSGSTGDPKGVTLTHANMLANIRAIGKAVPIKPTDVNVSWLPLYHDMGLMNWLASFYFGLPATILSPITFLTRPEQWLWTIHYHRGTLSGGPNFAYELCIKKIDSKNIEGLDLSSWKFAFNGAEAINPKTLANFSEKFSRYGFHAESFAPVYGLAESTVGLTCQTQKRAPRIDVIQRKMFEKENKAIPSHDQNDKNIFEFVACGEAFSDHGIRIVNDEGQVLDERMVGNIQFKGPSSMQGYYNNSEATQKIFHNGWWDTGDLGYIADKELFMTGRKKDLIIKAGRNFYPEEIEGIVNQIPHVRKGCVVAFGVNDSKTGTEKLIIVAESYDLSDDIQSEIRSNIIEKMSDLLGATPDTIIIGPPHTIHKTSSGKLQRSACKQDYLNGKLARQRLSAQFQLFKLTIIGLNKKIANSFFYFLKLLYLIYVAAISCFEFPLFFCSVLLLPRKMAAKICHFLARQYFRLCGCSVTLIGQSHLTEQSPTIFVSNHASYADSLLLLGILPPDATFVGKKELLKSFIMRKFIKKLGIITVDRMDFVKSIEDKKIIEQALHDKHSIAIFPEGTFTYATGLRPFKLGAFSLATETSTPICPIAIAGTRAILRGDTFFPWPGKIRITVGAPIIPKGNDWNEVIKLHSATRSHIAKYCGEPVIDIISAGPV